MKLALRELRRRPGRFAAAVAILTLIATLLTFLGGLLDGLLGQSTGAIRAQQGDLIVYSTEAKASFLRSRLEPGQIDVIAGVDGVTAVDRLSLVQLGARVPGNGPRDLVAVALFGAERPPQGIEEIPPDGSVVADSFLRESGVEEGMTILLGPSRTPVTVVGFVDDTNYAGQGALWGTLDTWRTVTDANRPGERLGDGVVQAVLVTVDGDDATVAAAIDAATGDATDTLTITEAIDAIPGVKEQRGTFGQIIGVTLAIAAVVIALFFALLTTERLSLYGVLKAIGASSRSLFAGVIVQAVVLTAIAATIGGVLMTVFDVAVPKAAIPFALTPGRLITTIVLLVVAAIVGSSFSLRRLLRVDPAAAIGSGS
jgi:putative ABC transport system permease protein